MRLDEPKVGLRTDSNTTAHYRAKEIGMTILYECTKCGCTDMTDEDVTYETFSQTQEEPGEYEWRCPECLSDAIEEVSAFWCKGCDDVQVKDDGDYCGECHQCMLEDKADARRDDMMMGDL
jgi:hypothetical protein